MISLIKKTGFFLLLLSSIGFLYSAKNASYCGMSFLSVNLPFSVKPTWFNGGFWLVDEGGWGVITPGSEFDSVEGQNVEVKSVIKYAFNSDVLYVWFRSTSEKLFYAVIDQPKPSASSLKIYSDEASPISSILSGHKDLTWKMVDVNSCYGGRASFLFLSLLVLSLASLVVAFFKERSR